MSSNKKLLEAIAEIRRREAGKLNEAGGVGGAAVEGGLWVAGKTSNIFKRLLGKSGEKAAEKAGEKAAEHPEYVPHPDSPVNPATGSSDEALKKVQDKFGKPGSKAAEEIPPSAPTPVTPAAPAAAAGAAGAAAATGGAKLSQRLAGASKVAIKKVGKVAVPAAVIGGAAALGANSVDKNTAPEANATPGQGNDSAPETGNEDEKPKSGEVYNTTIPKNGQKTAPKTSKAEKPETAPKAEAPKAADDEDKHAKSRKMFQAHQDAERSGDSGSNALYWQANAQREKELGKTAPNDFSDTAVGKWLTKKGGDPADRYESYDNSLINRFLQLNNSKNSNMFESAKKLHEMMPGPNEKPKVNKTKTSPSLTPSAASDMSIAGETPGSQIDHDASEIVKPAAPTPQSAPAPATQQSQFKFNSKKGGMVTADELSKWREHVGNKNATLGQYLNQRDGLTAKKGGANDPSIIQGRLGNKGTAFDPSKKPDTAEAPKAPTGPSAPTAPTAPAAPSPKSDPDTNDEAMFGPQSKASSMSNQSATASGPGASASASGSASASTSNSPYGKLAPKPQTQQSAGSNSMSPSANASENGLKDALNKKAGEMRDAVQRNFDADTTKTSDGVSRSGDMKDIVGRPATDQKGTSSFGNPNASSVTKNIKDEELESGPLKGKKKMSESTLINAFMKLQNVNNSNIFEAAKKAKKDWDGDGKVESEKDEVWGSRFKAAKNAGKMEEELIGNQKKLDKNRNGKLDKQDFKMLRNMNEASRKSKAEYEDSDDKTSWTDDEVKKNNSPEGLDTYAKQIQKAGDEQYQRNKSMEPGDVGKGIDNDIMQKRGLSKANSMSNQSSSASGPESYFKKDSPNKAEKPSEDEIDRRMRVALGHSKGPEDYFKLPSDKKNNDINGKMKPNMPRPSKWDVQEPEDLPPLPPGHSEYFNKEPVDGYAYKSAGHSKFDNDEYTTNIYPKTAAGKSAGPGKNRNYKGKMTSQKDFENTNEEVEFSENELISINRIAEAIAVAGKDQKVKAKGMGDTVSDANLTDETISEARGRPKGSSKADVNPNTIEGRDPRQHIQVIAGQAAAGRVIDFKHNNGDVSKISPGMGRKIGAHLAGLKPADKQAAVNKMHDSAEGLKV